MSEPATSAAVPSNPKQQQHLAMALLGLKTPEISPTTGGFPQLVDLMASAPPVNLRQGSVPPNASMVDAGRVREQLQLLLQSPMERQAPKVSPTAGKPARPTTGKTKGSGGKSSDARSGCNCKRSRCLKLYCVCFAAKEMCTGACNCQACHNSADHEADRQKAIQGILERNPAAFDAKFAANGKGAAAHPDPSQAHLRHKRGCRCRKSGCLKKYCECFQAAAHCGERCVCVDCKNVALPSNQPPPSAGAAVPAGPTSTTRAPPPPLIVPPQDNATQPLPKAILAATLKTETGIAASPSLGRKRARGGSGAGGSASKRGGAAGKASKAGGKAPRSPTRPVPPMAGRAISMPPLTSRSDAARYSLMEAAEDLAWMKTGTPSPRKAARGVSDGGTPASLMHMPPSSLDDMGDISAQDLSSLYALSSAATSVASSPLPGFGLMRASPLNALLAAESQLAGVTPPSQAFFPPLHPRFTSHSGSILENPSRSSPYATWQQESLASQAAARAAAAASSLSGHSVATVGESSDASSVPVSLDLNAPAGAAQAKEPEYKSARGTKRSRSEGDDGEIMGSTDGSASSDSGDEVNGRKDTGKAPLEAVEEQPQAELLATRA